MEGKVCCVSCLLDLNKVDQFDLSRISFEVSQMGDLLVPSPKLEELLASIDSSTLSELRKCVFELYTRGFVNVPLLHLNYHFPSAFHFRFNGESMEIARGHVYLVLEDIHRSHNSLTFGRFILSNFRNQTKPRPKFKDMRTPQDRLAYLLQCHQKESIQTTGKYTHTFSMIWSSNERYVREHVMKEMLNKIMLNKRRLSLIVIDDVVRIGLDLRKNKGELGSVIADWLGRIRSAFGTLESVAVIVIVDMWKYGVDTDGVCEAIRGIPTFEPVTLFKCDKIYKC